MLQVGRLLWGIVGGLLLYNYYLLGLPGTEKLPDIGGWTGLLATITGGGAGMLAFQVREWTKTAKQETSAESKDDASGYGA